MTQKVDALAPFQPLELHARGQIIDALTQRRHALGWTGEDLDERAGWADRYAGKLEVPLRPAGRPSFHFAYGTIVTPTGACQPTAMGQVWLEALGLRLVLVDAATAAAIGAVPAPPASAPWVRQLRDANAIAGHRQARISKGARSAVTISAFEAADRTQVASLSFRVAVTDHPFLEARPDLKAQAEKIEADLAALADLIREAA